MKYCQAGETAILVSSSESYCRKVINGGIEGYVCDIHPTTDYGSTVWVSGSATIKCCK